MEVSRYIEQWISGESSVWYITSSTRVGIIGECVVFLIQTLGVELLLHSRRNFYYFAEGFDKNLFEDEI